VTQAAEQLCLLVQAESAAALENIDAIAGAEGVDGVFIGPADLSADMGFPGQADHPDVLAAIDHMIDRIHAAGKISGILTFAPDRSKYYAERGVGFVGIGADVAIFGRALKATLDAVR
jgi:4-hydroxy-2-oxoheptanedioate aldolase